MLFTVDHAVLRTVVHGVHGVHGISPAFKHILRELGT